MPTARIHGNHVHYDSVGTGAPLLLLLPQSTGPTGRHALIHGLAERNRVITHAQRGSGRSGPASSEWSMAALAEDVIALLDALELETAILLCHSTGCGIGLSAAARWPDRVAALVLATPWTYADTHLYTMQTLRKAAARSLDPEQYARFNAALLFPPAYRRANEAGFARMARDASVDPQDPHDIARRLDAILAFDARPLCPKIRCPTMVMTASDDQLMPSWFAVEAAEKIRDARLVAFDYGGHMLPETCCDEFTATVLEFLGTVSREPKRVP